MYAKHNLHITFTSTRIQQQTPTLKIESIYYGGITLLHSVVMHVLTGAFGAEMMAYIGGWRTKQMQHI